MTFILCLYTIIFYWMFFNKVLFTCFTLSIVVFLFCFVLFCFFFFFDSSLSIALATLSTDLFSRLNYSFVLSILSIPFSIEETSLRHVAMVAKFLDDNKPIVT